jgi:hypothetical protein
MIRLCTAIERGHTVSRAFNDNRRDTVILSPITTTNRDYDAEESGQQRPEKSRGGRRACVSGIVPKKSV